MISKNAESKQKGRWLKAVLCLLLVVVLILPVLTFMPGSTGGSDFQLDSPGLAVEQLTADDIEVAVNWGSRPQGDSYPNKWDNISVSLETHQPADEIAYVNWGSAPIQMIPPSKIS